MLAIESRVVSKLMSSTVLATFSHGMAAVKQDCGLTPLAEACARMVNILPHAP